MNQSNFHFHFPPADLRVFRSWIALGLLLGGAAPCRCESPELGWKFTPGQSLRYQLNQTAHLSTGVEESAQAIADVVEHIDYSWKVLTVDPNGTATIAVQVTNFSAKFTGPGGQEVRYDSQSTEEPQGFSAMLLPIGRRLVESEVTLTISPKGEVTMSALPDDLFEAAKSIPGGKTFALDGGAASFVSLARLGGPWEFPTPADTSWSTTHQADLPVLGKQNIALNYKWREPANAERVVIEQAMLLSTELQPGVDRLELLEQRSKGQITWDLAAGRPTKSTLSYSAELSTGANPKSKMTLESTIEFRELADETE